MDSIRLETLLEMVSKDVWIEEQKLKERNVRPPLRMPSFAECAGIVEKLLQTASVDGGTVRFDGHGSAPAELPAWDGKFAFQRWYEGPPPPKPSEQHMHKLADKAGLDVHTGMDKKLKITKTNGKRQVPEKN